MADGWTCSQCTFQNGTCLVCDMCGAMRQNISGWKCLNCTYDNLAANETCHVCQNPKPIQKNIGEASIGPPPPPPQLSQQATDSNGLPPPPQLSQQATDSNQSMMSYNGDTIYWICGQCTYTNNANLNRDKCDLCGGKRETMTLGGYDNNHYINHDEQNIGNLSDNAIFEIMEHDLPCEPNYQHFKSCLLIIIENAPSPKGAITVLKSLKKITSRVSDQKPKYRTLDTRTEGVQTKLLGFEGSLEYLQLLGYTLDASQTRLQCLKHPSQQLLDQIIVLIDDQLNIQREKVREMKRSKRSEMSIPSEILMVHKEEEKEDKKEDEEEEEEAAELKLDSGEFTLSQLVGLVTHETFYDESAMKVLLLCHRCFSSSLELIEAIRKRFFIPAPEAANKWTEAEIIVWCQTIQRPIQNQCVQILVEWITNYFYVDFYLQPEVLIDLQTFVEQVLECKYEADDGWYDSLSTYLTSAIENGQRKILNSKLMISDDNKEKQVEHDADDIMDVKEVMELVQINYGFKKQRRSKLFGGKSAPTDLRLLFYKYSAQHIAEQLTLKDFKYFSHIHAREFLDKVWKGNKNKNKCVDLQKMIDRFNAIHKYIKISIIIPKQLSDRVLVLQHMIALGKSLFDLRNFFSLMAVFSALDSIQIGKLKYMWCRLDHTHKILLNNLSAICDANTNYKSQRKLMRKSFEIGMPVIPYVGLFLSDLTFVNQGAAKLVEGFINFKRFERFNERCKIVESFQKISYKREVTQLSMIIENDIQILNSKMTDAALKMLLAEAQQLDEKNSTSSERQMVKKMQAKKKRKRAKFKKT